jgi:hypothetical protein
LVILLVDSGKEAFQMARMRLLWLPSPRALKILVDGFVNLYYYYSDETIEQ